MDERTRQAVNFLAAAMAALFLILTILYLTRVLPHRGSLSGLFWVDLMIAGLVLLLGSGYNKHVVLHQDSIEVAGWFYGRKLNFSEICGRQTGGSAWGSYGYAYIFVPTDKSKRKLALPPFLETDQFFQDWIKTIPKIPR